MGILVNGMNAVLRQRLGRKVLNCRSFGVKRSMQRKNWTINILVTGKNKVEHVIHGDINALREGFLEGKYVYLVTSNGYKSFDFFRVPKVQ